MKSLLLLIGSVISFTANDDNTIRFVNWLAENNREYKTLADFEMRLETWSKKDQWINEFYQSNTPRNFQVGHNQFSDWSKDELDSMLTLGRNLGAQTITPNSPTNIHAVYSVPVSWDWRQHGAVTPVKNQGNCGGCWSFSAAAALEGSHAVQTGQLLSLSEQQFVSCVPEEKYGCAGCNGGDTWAAYQYWIDNSYDLINEPNYRFSATNGTCEYESKGRTRVNITDYYSVPMNNSAQLKLYMAKAPVALYITAGVDVFMNYQSGILDDPSCFGVIDHGVTGVGYGVTNGSGGMQGIKFWIVKNSWTSDWGENGYVRIQDTGDMGPGICGVNTTPYQPVTQQAE